MSDLDWSLFILFKAPPYALTRISPSLVPRSFSTLPPSEGNYHFAYLNAKLFAEMSSREYQQFCNARSKATANSGIASKLSANLPCTLALIFPTLDLPTGRILFYNIFRWYLTLEVILMDLNGLNSSRISALWTASSSSATSETSDLPAFIIKHFAVSIG